MKRSSPVSDPLFCSTVSENINWTTKQPRAGKVQLKYAEFQSGCVFFCNDSRAAIQENLHRRELKQANGNVKQNIPGRISAATQREEKIKQLVESPGRRGPGEAGTRRGRSAESREKRREGERQVRGYRGRARKGGGRSGVWLGERVLRSPPPPPPPQPSGGSPKNPTVLHKGQSSGRQRSKTCYSSSLPPPPPLRLQMNSSRVAGRRPRLRAPCAAAVAEEERGRAPSPASI